MSVRQPGLYGPIRAKMIARCKPEKGVIDFNIEFFEGGLEQFAHGLAGMQFARRLTESLEKAEQAEKSDTIQAA
ncbi:MAG: hypothetical protein V3T83_08635 [Acidobacteriota bacterium]